MIGKKEVIKVPKGIRYLGQNESNFNLEIFPNYCILDKQLPGCGFTEYCLTGSEPIILASPRIMLINNKADQHAEVLLIKNEMDKDPDVDKDLTRTYKEIKTKSKKESDLKELELQRKRVFSKIKSEILSYMCRMDECNKPMKILVTYDSYHIVQDILLQYERLGEFYTIVDEFQSILHDSRFKSSTEMQFLETLKKSPRVMFASATPMLDEYINELEEFNNLSFYKLDWESEDPTRIIKPNLDVYLMRSVGEMACKVIRTYLDGNFESVVVQRDGIPTKVTSTEAVLYVNSVSHIITIVKKLELTPDKVLILCSNTDANKKKIRDKLGKDFEIGKVPLKNEPRKMLTFCTRTVYLGADFYSDNARTFIFSDANIDSLAVDISEDLPQILGRQRLDENPWKNSATFFYRTTANYRSMTREDFENEIENKIKRTNNLLKAYNESMDKSVKLDLAITYQKLAKSYNYRDDYVGVNKIYATNEDGNQVLVNLKPKLNNLVLVNEKRAFNIQQIDYKDRFTIFAKLNNKLDTNDIINQEVELFFKNYEQLTTMKGKLKMLCECGLSSATLNVILSQIPDSDEIKSYYFNLGPNRLKELGYNITYIKKDLNIITFSENLLKEEIIKRFRVGEKLLLPEIKERLTILYKDINYIASPKATDILNYFEVKDFTRTVVDVNTGKKRRASGYELLLIKI